MIHVAWNKGKKGLQIAWNKGLKLPQFSGEKSASWKGDKIGYEGIHRWLNVTYGKANKCQAELVGLVCKHKSNKFEWALLKGEEYKRKRGNFIMLCTSCHRKYDFTEKRRKKAIKNLVWARGIPPWNKGKHTGIIPWNKRKNPLSLPYCPICDKQLSTYNSKACLKHWHLVHSL